MGVGRTREKLVYAGEPIESAVYCLNKWQLAQV